MKNKKLILFFLSFQCVFILSCERKKIETSTLVLKLNPGSGSSTKSQSEARSADIEQNSFSPGLSISNISEVNCYAVFVGGPEDFMRINNCKDNSTSTEKMRFGPYAGLFPLGSEISLEVPSGPERNIYLVGMKSQNNACQSFSVQAPDDANLSSLHIIGRQTLGLFPGTQVINMITNLDPNDKFDECQFQNNNPQRKPTQILITKDFFPRQGGISGSCMPFYIGTYDNNGRSVTTVENIEVKIKDSQTNTYPTFYSDSNCSNAVSNLTLSPGSQSRPLWIQVPVSLGPFTFQLEPLSVPTGISANQTKTFYSRYSTDNLFNYVGPKRILVNQCYRLQFVHQNFQSSLAGATVANLNSQTSANFYSSISNCQSNTPMGTLTSLSVTSSSIYEVWYKASNLGPKLVSFSGSSLGIDTLLSVEDVGGTLVAKAELISDYNTVTGSSCSTQPLVIKLVNSYGVAVPAPAGGVSVSLVKSSGSTSVNTYLHGDRSCGGTTSTSYTIPEGSSHIDVYYKVPAGTTGDYTMTATVNGANSNFLFKVQ